MVMVLLSKRAWSMRLLCHFGHPPAKDDLRWEDVKLTMAYNLTVSCSTLLAC